MADIDTKTRLNSSLNILYQGVMLAVTLFGVLAGAIAAYYSLATRLSDHDTRFLVVERVLAEQKKTETEYEAEMRAAVIEVSKTLTDLRVMLASQQHLK